MAELPHAYTVGYARVSTPDQNLDGEEKEHKEDESPDEGRDQPSAVLSSWCWFGQCRR